MEAQLEILVVGTQEKILKTVLRLLNANTLWKATGVSTAAQAVLKCQEKVYQVLLLGAGLTNAEEASLTAEAKSIHSEIHVIPHYGGGSGLLFAEIYLALGIRNQAQ